MEIESKYTLSYCIQTYIRYNSNVLGMLVDPIHTLSDSPGQLMYSCH